MTHANSSSDLESKLDALLKDLHHRMPTPSTAELDQKILDQIRHMSSPSADKLVSIERTPSKRWAWKVPIAVAAGLVAGVLIGGLLQQPEIDLSGRTDLQYMGDESGVGRVQLELKRLQDQSPEEWLDTIAEKLLERDLEQAQRLLNAFHKRYPNYEASVESNQQ